MSTTLSDIADSDQSEARGAQRTLLSGAASLFSSQLCRRVARALFLLIAARILGPKSSGMYVFLLAIVEVLAVMSGGGLVEYLTREAARFPESALRLSWKLTQLRWVYAAVLVTLAISVLHVAGYSPSVESNTALLSIVLFPRAVLESCQGVLRARNRLQTILWQETIQGAVLLGVGVPLLLRGAGLKGVILAEIASSLSGALVAAPVVFRSSHQGWKESLTWRQLISGTFTFNVYTLIVNIYDRVDVIILSKLAGDYAVGIYALPYRGIAMLQILPYGLMGALLPSLAKCDWNQADRKRCVQVMSFLYFFALFIVLGTMLLAHPVIRFTLGNSYEGSALALEILIWAVIPMFVNFSLNTFLLARNRERVFLWTASVCVVVNITANVMLIPRYSYIAAAGVTILTELVLLAQNLIFVRKALGFVPVPAALIPTTVGFLGVLGIGLIGIRYVPSIPVAVIAICLFLLYLQGSRIAPWIGMWPARATTS